MNGWQLPTTISVAGQTFAIRSDFRAVLAACRALNAPDLDPTEQATCCLRILVPRWRELPDPQQAVEQLMIFINLGQPIPEHQPPRPQLIDWEGDAGLIAPAVDRVLGYSCRRCSYLHWWEFVGAYTNIGQGLLADVVNVRRKRATGKKLEPWEKEFIRENPELVHIEKPLTEEEAAFFRQLGV